jgi:hypothetical protein
MNTIDVKNKFVDMCIYISNDDGGDYDFWWDYLDNNDENYEILKTKMINLLKLINENKDILKMDIENEIWDLI